MYRFAPFTLEDFSGGFTDNYVGCPVQKCKKNYNFVYTEDAKPVVRPGSVLYNSTDAQIPAGNQRVSALMPYAADEDLFWVSARNIYYQNSGWQTLTGPVASNGGLSAGAATDCVSWAQWNRHIFVTNDGGSAVQKIFKDGSNVYQVRTAGLPALAEDLNYTAATVLANAITLANELRTDMKAHFTSVTAHKVSDSVSDGIIASGAATDLATLLSLTSQLLLGYINHYNDYIKGGTYHYDETVDGNVPQASAAWQTLANTLAPTTLPEACARLNDLKLVYNTHSGNADVHNNVVSGNVTTSAFVYGVTTGPDLALDYAAIYAAANLLKAQYNAHLLDGGTNTKAHSTAADSTNVVASSNATTPETLEALVWELRYRYGAIDSGHDVDAELGAGWAYHVAHEASDHSLDVRPFLTSTNQYPEDFFGGLRAGRWSGFVTILNELRTKINGHILDLSTHYTTDPTALIVQRIPGTDITLANYNYAFIHSYDYTVGTVSYEDLGPVLLRGFTDVLSIGYQPAVITGIPTLANHSTGNYDTATIKIKIYRTVNNGTVYYLAGEVPNGTVTFTDSTTDDVLIGRERLYTTGGVVENSPPPLCKYIHIVEGKAYYGNITENGESLAYRIRQSIDGDPDSAPGDFFVDLDGDVTGIGSALERVVGFTDRTAYRIDGSFDELGRGGMTRQKIYDGDGCIANNSIVKIEEGMVYWGRSHIYYSDGYRVIPLNEDWATTYRSLISSAARKLKVQGAYDRDRRKVWWTIQSAGGSDNDRVVVLDLRFGIKPNATFSILENGTSFAPSYLLYYSGQMLRADTRGYTFKHDEAYYSDPKVNTGTTPSTWPAKAITFDYITCASDLGTSQQRKWVPKMSFVAKNETGNLSLAIQSINDDGRITGNLKEVRIRDEQGLHDQKRWFPQGNLRCEYKQLRFTNAWVVITSSDAIAAATVNSGAKTATLSVGNWSTDPIDFVIAFEADGYVIEYTVTARTPTVLTFADPGSTCPTGVQKWVLRGYPKDERFHLLDVTVDVGTADRTQDDYKGDSEDTGSNA